MTELYYMLHVEARTLYYKSARLNKIEKKNITFSISVNAWFLNIKC